jgi:uncharacterized FAD-dependent dehydrogenase
MKFSDKQDIKVYGDDESTVDPIKLRAARNGMSLLSARIRHLGTENNEQIMKNIFEFLKGKVDIRFGCEVSDFEEKPEEFLVNYIALAKKDNELNTPYSLKCKYLVLQPGRSGNRWFGQQAKDHGLKIKNNQIDIGVRVEFPELIGREIGSILYEPKLVIRTKKTGLKARTFCWNNGGHVVAESVTDKGVDYLTVNGHSFNDESKKTANSNFALLVSEEFTEPFKDPIAYSTAKRMTELNLQPTLKDAEPGDLRTSFPAKQWNTIIEAMETLEKIIPGVNGDDTIFYGPEIKWYSARAELSNKLEATIPNLFCGGDGAGVSRGIVQAAMCGIIIGEEIAGRE